MTFHSTSIAVFGSEHTAAALNPFVAAHRVLAVKRTIVPGEGPRQKSRLATPAPVTTTSVGPWWRIRSGLRCGNSGCGGADFPSQGFHLSCTRDA